MSVPADSVRLPGRRRGVTCVLRFDLEQASLGDLGQLVVWAKTDVGLEAIGELKAEEVHAAAKAGRNLIVEDGGPGARRTVPPRSVRSLARWLSDKGLAPFAPVGARSRPSALASGRER